VVGGRGCAGGHDGGAVLRHGRALRNGVPPFEVWEGSGQPFASSSRFDGVENIPRTVWGPMTARAAETRRMPRARAGTPQRAGTSLPASSLRPAAVSDVMSPRPITVGPDATLLDALVLMRGQKVSGLPVVEEDGTLVGVLSQRDVARTLKDEGRIPEVTGLFDLLMFDLAEQRGATVQVLRTILEETNVREAMSSPPISIAPEASLKTAADTMRVNEINRIPVIRGGRLVGIITRTDLVNALGKI